MASSVATLRNRRATLAKWLHKVTLLRNCQRGGRSSGKCVGQERETVTGSVWPHNHSGCGCTGGKEKTVAFH
eukprot:3479158-Rhodomonas_salina.3